MWRRNLFIVGYVILIHVVLAVVLLRSAFWDRLRLSVDQSDRPCVPYSGCLPGSHRRMDALVPDGSVLLFGDSIIEGACGTAIAERGANFGIGGDTTDGILSRLSLYTCLERASAVVLSVGYNDLSVLDNQAIVNNYERVLSLIPDDIAVLVCSVLPTDERCRPERFNGRIMELNRKLERLVAARRNGHFVDTAGDLRDCDGNLVMKCHEGDGIHLNSDGYMVYIARLRAALQSVKGVRTCED